MKIFIVACIFASFAYCSRPNDKCWEQCDFKEFLVQIICPPDTTSEVCTCMEKEGNELKECTVASGEIQFVDWEGCQALAKAHSGLPDNNFFRFEKQPAYQPDHNVCYFLDACIQHPSHCAPFEAATCVAGPSNEPCSPEIEEKCGRPDFVPKGIHWQCEFDSKFIDAYAANGDDSKLPIGTICQTIKGCSTWLPQPNPEVPTPQTAIAECKVAGWEGTPTLQDGEGTNILPDVNDGICICDPLVLNEGTLETPGLSLLCDTVLSPTDEGKFQIEDGNACLLSCDGHFVLYAECYEGQWMNTAEFPFSVKGPDDIAC